MTSSVKFPQFSEIPVSTKTYTATTNLVIDIKTLFENLPVTPYQLPPKKRARKPAPNEQKLSEPPTIPPKGSIISLKFEGQLRGVDLSPQRRGKTGRKKWFRNSVTIVLMLDKPINFKVCKNGTFQMTGCKNHAHAEACVKHIWTYIQKHPSWFSFSKGTQLEVLFIPSMRNIDFSLGFLVDLQKLNKYMYNNNDSHCLLETSFGYTGVNIKIPLTEDITQMPIQKHVYDTHTDKWTISNTIYQEFLDNLPQKERNNKLKARRYNTFLIFHSGRSICSGLTREYMETAYNSFTDLIRKGYDQIEERLEPPCISR
jgi:TATA-box binding protein (TBP) (component of TFIID and TFIIIB)